MSFSLVGVGAGLINTRDHNGEKDRQIKHYVLYDGFVTVVALFIAMGVLFELNGAFSASTALIIGFLEDRFRFIAGKQIDRIK